MPLPKTPLILLLFIALSRTAFATPNQPENITPDSAKLITYSNSLEKVSITDSIINYGKLFLNTPYRYGGSGTKSFDCSGFTSHVYQNFGVALQRSSHEQASQFPHIKKEDLKPGDLVFFEGRKRNGRVGHVGIVTEAKENGEFDFIHASVNSGVIITNSKEDYYVKRYVGGGRVLENDLTLKVTASNGLQRQEYVSNSPSQSVKKVIPAKYHYVKRGETLSSIASKYDMSIAQLKKKNGLKKDGIQIKQRLLIKEEETKVLVNPVAVSSTLKNDSLNSKSALKTDLQETTIRVPILQHVVERGETMYSISQKYNLTTSEIKNLNKIIDGKIYPGQVLILSEELPIITENKIQSEQKAKTEEPEIQTQVVEPIIQQPLQKNEQVKSDPKKSVVSTQKKQKETTKTQAEKLKEENKSQLVIKQQVHMVRSGESLMSISRKYNTTTESIKELNGLSGNTVELGQTLVIFTNNPDYTPVRTQLPKIDSTKTVATAPKLPTEKAETPIVTKAEKANTEKVSAEKTNNEKPKVEVVEKTVENKPKTSTHQVQRGESLYSIAKQYNLTIDELKELNQLNSNALAAGQKIKVYTDGQTAKTTNPVKKETTVTHKVKRGETYSSIAQKYGCKINDIKRWNNRTNDRLNVGESLKIQK